MFRLGAFLLTSLVLSATLFAAARSAPGTLALSSRRGFTFVNGEWEVRDGELRQPSTRGQAYAFLKRPVLSDTALSFQFRVWPEGTGVRAAGALLRSADSRSFYGVHFDCRSDQVILYASSPDDPASWTDLARKKVVLEEDRWYTARVEARGKKLLVSLEGEPVLEAEDARYGAGLAGVYTSEGSVSFREIRLEGEPGRLAREWKNVTPSVPRRQTVAAAADAGGYTAFPDLCRAPNGDLICVFYSGYDHISVPNEKWPDGGRVMMVRSRDCGKSWGKPEVVADTPHDDRDPHVAALSDGTLLCNWFVAWNPKAKPAGEPHGYGMFLSRSRDNGRSWSAPERLAVDAPTWYVCSAPIRKLPDGSLILGLYTEAGATSYGATVKSYDRGRTWRDLATIGKDSGLFLDAETDVIRLKDGSLLAALRSSRTDLYFSTSTDGGKSWSPVRSSGFKGHCPIFLRTRNGTILLAHRLPHTSLHWSSDEGKTWQGPLILDPVIGAYPGLAELPDGSVYCVYYVEGAASDIRGVRLRVDRNGVRIAEDRR